VVHPLAFAKWLSTKQLELIFVLLAITAANIVIIPVQPAALTAKRQTTERSAQTSANVMIDTITLQILLCVALVTLIA
jgi:peptidoglycan hydrolase-like amidase